LRFLFTSALAAAEMGLSVSGQNEAEVVTEEASTSSAPARKGWWQRKLGGE